MSKNKSYGEKICEESLFWGQFEEEANKFGIPWWCDLRRATKLTHIISGWMYDPKIEEILRGHDKNRLIRIAKNIKGDALDIGCGAGWLSLELARNGMIVDGIEISKKRIDVAKTYFENNPFVEGFGAINYQVKDLNKIKLAKRKYQAVVSWDTLHHITAIDKLIKEIYESLKTGGYFVIYDHIGLKGRNRLLINAMNILLSILSRMKKISESNKKNEGTGINHNKSKNIFRSPFEDVTGDEMVDVIRKHFRIITLETQLCFLAGVGNNMLDFPDIIKYTLVKGLKLIDDLLIKIGILKGEYIFIVAKK